MAWYKFWIKSNRGTNEVTVRHIRDELERMKPKDRNSYLRSEVEEWCSNFGAWSHPENIVRFGWEKIENMPKRRKVLVTRYLKLSAQYRKVDTARKLAQAMLLGFDRAKQARIAAKAVKAAGYPKHV